MGAGIPGLPLSEEAPYFSESRCALFIECGLSASSAPKSKSSTASRRRPRADSASTLSRQRRPSADRASAASNRRLDVGIVNRAPTTSTERPLNADRASTERRPSTPATRGPLWRRLVFGVWGSLGGLHSHARVLACSCCASPSVLCLASLSALSTSGVPHCPSLCGLCRPEVRKNTSGASGGIEGPKKPVLVPAPPDSLSFATLPRDCPLRPSPPPPPSPSGGKARVAGRGHAPCAWSAIYGLLPQR